jgi:hypothetical protein
MSPAAKSWGESQLTVIEPRGTAPRRRGTAAQASLPTVSSTPAISGDHANPAARFCSNTGSPVHAATVAGSAPCSGMSL